MKQPQKVKDAIEATLQELMAMEKEEFRKLMEENTVNVPDEAFYKKLDEWAYNNPPNNGSEAKESEEQPHIYSMEFLRQT